MLTVPSGAPAEARACASLKVRDKPEAPRRDGAEALLSARGARREALASWLSLSASARSGQPCSPPVRSSDGPVMVAVRLYSCVSPARASGACAIPPCSPPVRSSDGPVMAVVRLYRPEGVSSARADGACAIPPCSPPGLPSHRGARGARRPKAPEVLEARGPF